MGLVSKRHGPTDWGLGGELIIRHRKQIISRPSYKILLQRKERSNERKANRQDMLHMGEIKCM
jgi:hypothetical protein